MAINAAQAYKNNSIKTASPAELTLMLYNGAIKFVNIANAAIEENDVEKAHTNIRKAQNIIEELWGTLDHKYPVWEDFDRVYRYIYQKLIEGNVHKDKEALEEALGRIREMRDTWQEVMKKSKGQD